MKTPNTLRAALGAVLLSGAALAGATPLTWQLSGVAFDDGTTATGTLTYDAATDMLLSYSIAVQGGALPAFTYTAASAANSCARVAGGNDPRTGCNTNDRANEIFLGASDGSQFLSLYLASALGAGGGNVALVTSGNYQSYEIDPAYDFRAVTAGSLASVQAAADVPEPASIALLGIAAAGMFGAAGMQKQRARRKQ